MKKLVLALVATFMLVALSAGVALAQEPAAGEGGIIIQGNTRGSANLGSFIQLRCSGVDCRDSGGLMFPSLLGLDPVSLTTAGADTFDGGQLALNWTISEDGLVYTFNLRQDAFWTDGEQITADDVYFSWLAVEQGEAIELSGSYLTTQRDIENIEIVDDFTIDVTVASATCTIIDNISFPVDPSHAFGWTLEIGEDFDWTIYTSHAQNTEPTVTAGPFLFSRAEPGTAIYLAANTDYYAATSENGVLPQGWVFLDVLDDTILTERFLAGGDGEPNFIFEPPANQYETLRNSDAQYFQAPATVWHYFAMNLADPDAASNGFDADGNYVDQGVHPIFGDVRVRQALQYALDIDEIILGAQNGDATPMVSSTIPTAFSIHPTLERRPNDPELAASMLTEAGWVDEDGDGVRECHGCLHAEEGTPFSFELLNPTVGGREDVAILAQAQFAEIGVEVEVMSLDFNGMYDQLESQSFDAAIAGWRGGIPFDPDQRAFFGTEQDIFSTTGEGAGFNFPSYQNPVLDELMESVNLVPGCDLDARLAIAYEIQEIMWEEQPYLWLYSLENAYVAADNIGNFDPLPAQGRWNIDAWYVQQ